jgi:hypothetical protein
MRALAAKTTGGISKHLMHKIADGYERFAQTIEQRPNRFPQTPAAVPIEVRRFAPWKKPAATKSADAKSPGASRESGGPELPGFLKRGPAAADDLGSL